jgi:hypothetical protein
MIIRSSGLEELIRPVQWGEPINHHLIFNYVDPSVAGEDSVSIEFGCTHRADI